MRRLLLILALVVALPLSASAEYCLGTSIDRFDDGSPKMGELLVDPYPPVRVQLEGLFLWIEAQGEITSFEIPADAIGFTACESGTLTFTYPAAEVAPGPSGAPEIAPVAPFVDAETYRPWSPGSAF